MDFFNKWTISCLFIVLWALLQGEEKLFCPFDDRIWKIGFEDQIDKEKITELILKDEDITQWNELFTVEIFKDLSISASDFMNAIERIAKNTLSSQEILHFEIIAKDPLNIFESSFIYNQDPKPPFTIVNNEYNIGRVIKEKSVIYYIRYSTKDANLFKQNKEAWIKRFKLAYLAQAPLENQQGRWMTFTSQSIYDQNKQLLYQSEYQFIKNKEGGYILSIPKDWAANRIDIDIPSAPPAIHESLRFSSPDKAIEGQVGFLDLPEKAVLNTASLQYYNSYKKNHPQAKLIGKGNIQTVIGQDGKYFILIDGDKKGWITFMCVNKRVYCLELWTQRAQFKDLKDTLEKIILNFVIQP